MKEDINKLEIKILETKESAFPTYWTKEDATLVEKLIARYKELEEKNIKYERANDYLSALNRKYYEDNVTLLRKNGKVDILADDIHFKYIDMVENYIPKSKVREKIEECEKALTESKNNAEAGEYEYRIEIYEELL